MEWEVILQKHGNITAWEVKFDNTQTFQPI